MKKVLLTTTLLLLSINVALCDSFSLNIRSDKSDSKSSSWSGLSIGYNALCCSGDTPSYLSQSPASFSINLNLIDAKLVNVKNFSIVTGLGFEFNNFRFNNNTSLTTESGVLAGDYSYEVAGITLKKSKLNTNYLVVPLLFEWTLNDKTESYINFGVIGGWMYNAHTKVKYDEGKIKARDVSINTLRYGYTLMFGTSCFGVYARYYPSSIFKNDGGLKVSQFNVGLHFNAGLR